ncbi:hypothetical protein ABT354_12030 [Streptomyces sp. NPDC000594]|uniref:hypothetical protein n=1 Tax=Streptomyces sp. NPDC000594 TaxID=3154261 RepID=UPI003329AFE3
MNTHPGHPRHDTVAAIAAATAQFLLAVPLWVIADAHAVDGYGEGTPFFSVLLLVFLLPPLAVLCGPAHAVTLTLPVRALAERAAARTTAPWLTEPRWRALLAVVLAAVHATVWALLGFGFLTAWAWTAASAVAPLLAVSAARRRARVREFGAVAVWFRSIATAILAAPVAFGLVLAALATGVLPEYRPPALGAAELRGVWEGPDGATLRLEPGERAVLINFDDGTGDSCDGTGSWWPKTNGTHRDTVTLTPDGQCPASEWWIGGTAEEPELYEPTGYEGGPYIFRRRD